MTIPHLDLSVNLDHVATLRNARGGTFPDPFEAARVAVAAGADGVTLHLREDRRHVRDADVARVRAGIAAPLNLEMAATPEMVAIALDLRPPYCCLVPEKRAELTTEGGLDVAGAGPALAEAVARLRGAGIRVSLFVDAEGPQVAAAAAIGAAAVELHTGPYAEAAPAARPALLSTLRAAAARAKGLGLLCHAGHGLDYATTADLAALPEVTEISIGHFLVSQSLFEGLDAVVRRLRGIVAAARTA